MGPALIEAALGSLQSSSCYWGLAAHASLGSRQLPHGFGSCHLSTPKPNQVSSSKVCVSDSQEARAFPGLPREAPQATYSQSCFRKTQDLVPDMAKAQTRPLSYHKELLLQSSQGRRNSCTQHADDLMHTAHVHGKPLLYQFVWHPLKKSRRASRSRKVRSGTEIFGRLLVSTAQPPTQGPWSVNIYSAGNSH